ncbi:MAG: aldo/keto reductase [Cyclobacteriaceae bacterium]
MEKVHFGESGILVSRVGLGLAALGRPGYINLGHADDLNKDYDINKMEQQTYRMLDAALEQGVNYFDAAQSYGKSENVLSSWLKKKGDEEVVIGSKWGYTYTADWQVSAEHHEVKEHSIIVLNRQWRLSHKKLAPALKLYQVHSATFESGVLDNSQVLDRLAEIQDTGVQIGLSLSGVQQSEVLKKAMKTSVEGKLLFDAVQVTNNLLEHSTDQVLEEAADRGMGIIVKEGLANGRLTSRNTDLAYSDTMTLLRRLAEGYNVGIDAIALSYLLSKPYHHIVLSGAATVEHLNSNLMADSIELSKTELASLDNLQLKSQHYWKERGQMVWN